MSYSHINMRKLYEDDGLVGYEVASFDFNKERHCETFGIIEINKINGTYTHKDNALWEKNKIYPVNLFEVPADKRPDLLYGKYEDYGSVTWAINVFNFIKKCLESKIYPDEKALIS